MARDIGIRPFIQALSPDGTKAFESGINTQVNHSEDSIDEDLEKFYMMEKVNDRQLQNSIRVFLCVNCI